VKLTPGFVVIRGVTFPRNLDPRTPKPFSNTILGSPIFRPANNKGRLYSVPSIGDDRIILRKSQIGIQSVKYQLSYQKYLCFTLALVLCSVESQRMQKIYICQKRRAANARKKIGASKIKSAT